MNPSHFRKPDWWVAGIAAGLFGIHLILMTSDKVTAGKQFGLSSLCWLVASVLAWEKRGTIAMKSGPGATLLGLLLVAVVLLKSVSRPEPTFILLMPAISGLGVALLASGFQGALQNRKELAILAVLGTAVFVDVFLVDLLAVNVAPLTARMAGLFLRCAGYSASVDAYHLGLPEGGITVVAGCSGLKGMTYLLSLAFLFVLVFPPSMRLGYWITPLVAVAIGFLVNSVRIALLAVYSAQSGAAEFDYWHVGQGSSVLGAVSTLLFGLFCLWLIMADRRHPQRTALDVHP